MDYNSILEKIRDLKQESFVDPDELNKLSDLDRKKIEYELMLNILDGNKRFYCYIPYIAYYNVIKNINEAGMKERIDSGSVIELEKNIYKKTNDVSDLSWILKLYKRQEKVLEVEEAIDELVKYNYENSKKI